MIMLIDESADMFSYLFRKKWAIEIHFIESQRGNGLDFFFNAGCVMKIYAKFEQMSLYIRIVY